MKVGSTSRWPLLLAVIICRILPWRMFFVVVVVWAFFLIVSFDADLTPMLPIDEQTETIPELTVPSATSSPRIRSFSLGYKRVSLETEPIKSPANWVCEPGPLDTNIEPNLALRSPSQSHVDWNSRLSRDLYLDTYQLYNKVHFQVASDLHIETIYGHRNVSRSEIEEKLAYLLMPSAPCLILAGDIGCPGSVIGEQYFRFFLDIQSRQFRHVFIVAGNHEYYCETSGYSASYLSAPEIHSSIKRIVSTFTNVHFLDRKAVLLDSLRIIGCTLWTNVDEARQDQIQSCISDYRRIHVPLYAGSKFPGSRPLTVYDTRIWHRHDLAFLERQLIYAKDNEQDVLIVTHHAPLQMGTSHPSHSGSALSSAFSNELSKLISSNSANLKAWVFGHTHFCCDFYMDGVRIYANQHGYHNDQDENFFRDGTIEV